jgi:hypothetical protein
MEYGAIAIPFLAAIYAYFFHQSKVLWWEFAILLAVPVVSLFIAKFTAESFIAKDEEYWTSYVVSASYEEPWDEYIYKRCTRTVGSGKNARTESYDCSYVKHHHEKWYFTDSSGSERIISEDLFESLVSRWGNRKFVEMNRRYHSRDGNKYVSEWKGDIRTIEVVTSIHSYENRVQSSNSVFKFQPVDPGKYNLYNYPKFAEDGYTCPSILGVCDRYSSADFSLSAANAALGARKQIRMWMLLFNDQPIEAGIEQESYWKGGNKNELVVCVGLKNKEVQWVYVFSWTPVEELKIGIRDEINKMKIFDAELAAKIIATQAESKWVRKQFKDFSYLSVQLDWKWILAIYALTGMVTFACLFIVINNQFDEESPRRKRIWKR